MDYHKLTQEDVTAIRALAADVVESADIHDDFCHDELAGEPHRPELLIRARDTQEISRVMKYAFEHHIPVTPRGQGTGLVGGAVPVNGGILLDLSLMNKILELDPDNMTVTVEAGVLLMELAAYCEAAGFLYPPDPARRPRRSAETSAPTRAACARSSTA